MNMGGFEAVSVYVQNYLLRGGLEDDGLYREVCEFVGYPHITSAAEAPTGPVEYHPPDHLLAMPLFRRSGILYEDAYGNIVDIEAVLRASNTATGAAATSFPSPRYSPAED